jgi:hypothetical protein
MPIPIAKAKGRAVAAKLLAERHRWTLVFFEVPLRKICNFNFRTELIERIAPRPG